MIRLALLVPAALLAVSAASAQTPSATPTAAATVAKSSDDKMICERQEVLGSRLQGRRVCKTASQWAQERQEARDAVQRAQTNRGCTQNNC